MDHIKSADSSLRTAIDLPNGSGKKIKVAVLCDESKLSDAKKSGAEIFGSDDLIKKISAGEIKFNKLICTPSMMSKMGKLGKILGPKGLMPNPKDGTVTNNVKDAVQNAKKGQAMYRSDKAGIIHCSIGKVGFKGEEIEENFNALIDDIKKSRPSSTKGTFIKTITMSSTMGPGIKIKES